MPASPPTPPTDWHLVGGTGSPVSGNDIGVTVNGIPVTY